MAEAECSVPLSGPRYIPFEEIRHLLSEADQVRPLTVRQLKSRQIDSSYLLWVRIQKEGVNYVIFPRFQFTTSGHVLPATASPTRWVKSLFVGLFNVSEVAEKIAAWWITPRNDLRFTDDDLDAKRMPVEVLYQLSLHSDCRKVADPFMALRAAATRTVQEVEAARRLPTKAV